jgi:hypothetical protein
LLCASAMFNRSVGVRKSDQQFNFMGVVGSVGLIFVVLYIWIFLISGGNKKKDDLPSGLEINTQVSGLYMLPTLTISVMPTYTPYPTYTVYPTITAVPTEDGWFDVTFEYSYYDPTLGGVNCADWDEVEGTCRSMMANGDDWRRHYGEAVACPLSYPLGTIIDVISPAVIAGEWVCMDWCPVCKEGDLIDFLQHAQSLPWREKVYVRVKFAR